ncbi:MAG TPA: type II toxin-antitoxin system HicB family antitoxin [Candidatus Binataceae bacterium]|nr:type II toxin-antitoxin system HicB family antitoxin [Candidatus Binataceae bacterium]
MSFDPRTTKGGADVTQYHYTAVFEPAVEGGYIASVPALPGLVTEGDTIEEARAMVKDAIRGYLESLAKHGEEIPIESGAANLELVEVNF